MPDLTSRNYTYSQARSQLQALGVNAENIENKKIEVIIQRQVILSLDNILLLEQQLMEQLPCMSPLHQPEPVTILQQEVPQAQVLQQIADNKDE